jgi:hypothetical protein
MNRDAALKSAVCFWSQEDDCYLVDSLTFSCPAHGDTPEEAWDRFNRFLNETYIDYKEGKLRGYTKAGRPSKGGLSMHVRVRPSTKDEIDKIAKKFGVSQGEAIDYLVNFHEIAVLPHKPGDKPTKPNSMELPPQAVSILKARNVTRNVIKKTQGLKKSKAKK